MAVHNSLRGAQSRNFGKNNDATEGLQRVKMPKMCLDWRVLVGLAVVGVELYVVAPGTVVAALPILSLVACPLSMLLIIKAMRVGPGEGGGSRATDDGSTREEQLARMRGQQRILCDRIDALERDEA